MLEKYNLQSVFGLYRYNMNDILFHAVKEMICGPLKKGSYIKATTYQALSPSRHFLYDIVSNKTNLMNVDKWEGLSRDSFQCGLTQTRNIMHERFMKFAKVLQTPTEGEQMTAICYRDKVAADVCEMLQARYRQRELTTFHKVKIAVDLMISDAFEAAADHLTFTTQNGDIVRLASVLEDMDAYLMLDDKIIDTILQSYNNEMLRDSREIVERIQRRRLYKFVGRLRLPPRDDEQDDESVEADAIRLEKTTAEDIVRHHDNNGTLEAADLCLTTVSMDYGLENEHPIERMQFYRKDTETPIHIGRKEVSYQLEPTFLGKSLFIYVRNEARKDNAKRCIQQFARHCGLVIDNE
ncbi:deoxynucleoside triphosphate triphosphohydrolase SAMHD1-like [Ptychodera flava]|uniref:deoxynucleoside triphosphate triphosphohydrolase SAMHD1-like n=1 Tax=Ptychodera flava TaxID=63121 RepID=UPI00396A757B